MPPINPTPERLARFLAESDDDTPIVMINLLKYRERAEYPEDTDAEPCSGRDAYNRYGAVAIEKVNSIGGRLLWLGSVEFGVITEEGEPEWDEVAIVQYPSRRAFLEMVSMPDYQAAMVHRTAALADTRLIATKTQVGQLP